MKKTSKVISTMLMATSFAFGQTAEFYSDNNIEYPSFDTGSPSGTVSGSFNPDDYVLDSLNLSDIEEMGNHLKDSKAPDIEDILPTINPAESYILTSSSGNGLETYDEEDLQTPSRSMKIAQNQYIDVEYPGKGWLYLGETDNTTLMRYFGHSLSSDTVFTLRAKSQGTALLHFYKIDPLTGTAINDYLEIVISGKTTSDEHLAAPSYKEVVPSGQRKKTVAVETQDTGIPTEDSSVSNKEDDESKEYSLNDIESSIDAPTVEVSDIVSAKSEQPAELPKDNAAAPASTEQKPEPKQQPSAPSSPKPSAQSSAPAPKATAPASSAPKQSATQSTAPKTGTTPRSTSPAPSTGSSSRPAPQPSSPATRSTPSTSSPSAPAPRSNSSANASSTPAPRNNTSSAPAVTETPRTQAPQTSSPSAKKTDVPAPKKNATISSAADNELLDKAQKAYDKGQYGECLDYLTEFFNNAVTKIDEGLYLQGRALEAPSNSRNIKAALDTYETLVKRYPQSKKWKAANERIIYIKRFYFNIR